MLVHWELRGATQTCLWTFESAEFRFQVKQPVQEFFTMVHSLHDACNQIEKNIEDGMDPQKAIEEVEKMLKEKRKPAKLDDKPDLKEEL